MIVLPPHAMSDKDVRLLRKNGICVVVAKDPSEVRFVDPIPASSNRTEMEAAAVAMTRKLLEWPWSATFATKEFISELYCKLLVRGTSLDPGAGIEEARNAANAANAAVKKLTGKEVAK